MCNIFLIFVHIKGTLVTNWKKHKMNETCQFNDYKRYDSTNESKLCNDNRTSIDVLMNVKDEDFIKAFNYFCNNQG